MTAAVQLALDRRDVEITVSGPDTIEALQFIGANGGRVQAMARGKRNAEWVLEIYWQQPNAITND